MNLFKSIIVIALSIIGLNAYASRFDPIITNNVDEVNASKEKIRASSNGIIGPK